MLMAAKGRRTLLCELDSQQPALKPIFEVDAGLAPVQVWPDLAVSNLVWPDVLRAYLRTALPGSRLVASILDNAMVRSFLDFTPGSQELVQLSVLGDQLDAYDVVVVDMPASGHAFSFLDITRSALGLFRAGPVRRRAEELRAMLQEVGTRVVLVALPEEMVVNETLETIGRLREAELLGADPIVILNRATPPSLSEEERALLARLSKADLDADAEEFVATGRWERSLEDAAVIAERRLTEAFDGPPIIIPPQGAGGNPQAVARRVAVALGRMMGVTKRDLPWT